MKNHIYTYKIIWNRLFPDARLKRLKVKEPALLAAFWFTILLLDANGWLLLSMLVSVCHEFGHILVYRMLVGEWPDLYLSFFGICMYTNKKHLPIKTELLITMAGPGINFILAVLIYQLLLEKTTFLRLGAFWANLLIGSFNLLPVPPLDGWHILALLCRK